MKGIMIKSQELEWIRRFCHGATMTRDRPCGVVEGKS